MTRSTNMVIPERLEHELLRKSVEITDVFNEQSQGCIQLVNEPAEQALNGGDYIVPVRIKRPANLVTRADDVNPTNAKTVVAITQGSGKRVRMDLSVGPMRYYDNEVLRGFKRPEDYTDAIAELVASEQLVKIRNLGVAAAVAAVESADTTDGTTASANIHILDAAAGPVGAGTRADLTLSRINQLLHKMADARKKIKALLMPSECFVDLVGDQLATYKYTEACDATFYQDVVPVFGRAMIVADVPALITDLSSSYYDEYNVLGLGDGGIFCKITHQGAVETDRVISTEVPYAMIRCDFTVEIGVSGLKWQGGPNPTEAALATAANWDEDYEDHRDSLVVKGVFHSNSGA